MNELQKLKKTVIDWHETALVLRNDAFAEKDEKWFGHYVAEAHAFYSVILEIESMIEKKS